MSHQSYNVVECRDVIQQHEGNSQDYAAQPDGFLSCGNFSMCPEGNQENEIVHSNISSGQTALTSGSSLPGIFVYLSIT
jgi:hypothetical protein